MNLRDKDDRNTFPPRDVVIADILTPPPSGKRKYGNCCYALFIAIFRVLKSTFERYLSSTRGAQKLIERWNNEMCNFGSQKRTQWFEEVGKEHKKVSGLCILMRGRMTLLLVLATCGNRRRLGRIRGEGGVHQR